MALLSMIDKFPQFLQHLIIEDFVSFNEIINLAKSCKVLHQWVIGSFKAYNLLCTAYLSNDYSSFKIKSLFYSNDIEKELVEKIFKMFKDYNNLNVALICGNIINIEWLLNSPEKLNIIPGNNLHQAAIDYLLTNEKLDILELLKNHNYIITHNSNTINSINLNKNDSINSLEWIFNYCLTHGFKFNYFRTVFDNTYYLRRLKKAKWWLMKLELYPNIISFDINIMIVIENQDVNLLNYLLFTNKFPQGISIILEYINRASERGYIEIIEWFLNNSEHFIKNENYISDVPYLIIDNAASNGQIKVLEWFLNYSKGCYKHTPLFDLISFKYSEKAIDNASSHGYINIIEWFFKYYEQGDLQKFIYSEKAIDDASSSGHIDILEWFLKHYLQDQISEFKYSEQALINASKYGKINVIEWFHNHVDIINEFRKSKQAIIDSSRYGKLNELDWSHNTSNSINELKYNETAMKYAIYSGQLGVIEWYLDQNTQKDFKYSKTIENYIFECGQVTAQIWFLDCYVKFRLGVLTDLTLIKKSTYYNQTEIIKIFLYYFGESNENLDKSESSFDKINNSKIIQWYVESGLIESISTYETSEIIRYTTGFDLLNLFKKNNIEINFSYLLINKAISQGKLKVLEWFYNHCLEINKICEYFTNIDSALIDAVENGFTFIFDWFINNNLKSSLKLFLIKDDENFEYNILNIFDGDISDINKEYIKDLKTWIRFNYNNLI